MAPTELALHGFSPGTLIYFTVHVRERLSSYDLNDGERIGKTYLMPADKCALSWLHVCKNFESAFADGIRHSINKHLLWLLSP